MKDPLPTAIRGVIPGGWSVKVHNRRNLSPPLPWPEGMGVHLLKGDRGDREGRYLWVWEFESVEARDRLFPSVDDDEVSEEFQQFMEATAAVGEKSAAFAVGGDIYTDYVVVGR